MINIFKERQIKINISTNLDMKTQNSSEEKFIEFNISMLKIPNSKIEGLMKLEKYPYFTPEVKYPWQYLYNLPYKRKLEFFFNRNNFIKILTQYNKDWVNYEIETYNKFMKGGADCSENKKQFKKDAVKIDLKNTIVQDNIMMMLKCFFPTKYPYKSNIKTSYDLKIKKNPQYNLEVPENFLNLFRLYSDEKENEKIYTEYSYLKLDGKIYTVTEVVWINDIFNHPKYKNLTKEYFNLIFFKKTYSKNLSNINDIKINSFKSRTINDGTTIKTLQDLLNKLNPDKNSKKKSDDITLIRNLIENINKFKELFNNLKNKTKIEDSGELDENYNYIKKIIENFENYKVRLTKGYYNNPLFSMTNDLTEFFEQITILQNIITEIRENLYIYKTYLKENKLERKILFDKKIGEENKKKLKRYINFFKEVDNFVNSVYSTNNEYLQNCINNFINNTDDNLVTLINPSNLKNTNPPDEFCGKYIKYIYSGVNVDIVDDFNEIFIRLDLIEGEVNDDNKENIKCLYPGEKLTDKLDTLLSNSSKFWELNPRRMLFVLDEMKGYSKVGNVFETVPTDKDNDKDKEKDNDKYKDRDNDKYKDRDRDNEKYKDRDKDKPTAVPKEDEIINPFMNPFKGGKKNNTRKLKTYYLMN
jgi:hypothetical protein